jgi:hypothetical protein
MKLPAWIGLVDVGVVIIVVIAIVLPPRKMDAAPSLKADDSAAFALALSEARTVAAPTDGGARADFARRLDDAHLNDWAIEDAVRGSKVAKESPTRWRALIAASIAYVDRLDAKKALEYAKYALSACDSARSAGTVDACPDWEQIRMQLYHDHLDAGVKAGIDPKHQPEKFRNAGAKVVLPVHITGHDQVIEPQGSGSAH